MGGDSIRTEGPDYIRVVSIPVPDVWIDQPIVSWVCASFAGVEKNYCSHIQGGHEYVDESFGSEVEHAFV